MNRASEGIAGGWTIGRVDTRIGWILGFLAILTFYLATTPENRTDAADSYAYAYDTERRALTDLYDTRLLLFHVVMRLLYRAAHAIHDGVTAHAVLLTVSALSASLGLVLFARLLNRHFGLSLAASLLGAGFLGATYGFWRYSVEAEVYAPSMFLITAVLTLVFAAEDRADEARGWATLISAGVLAGLAVLFYQANAIPLFLALPVLFLRRGGFPRLIAYGAAGGGMVLLGYVVAFLVDEARSLTIGTLYAFVFKRFGEFELDESLLSAIVKSVVALGHAIVSGNWVFGLDIAAAVNEIVALVQYEERVFAASKAGVVLVYLPLFTLAMLVAVGAVTASIAVRAHRRPPLDRHLGFAFTWFGLYALVNGRLSPGSYEVWIMTLPPLIILFAAFVIEPCVRAGRRAAPTVLLAALVLHNAIGGIGILYGAGGDYHRAKGGWAIDNATADDLILLPVNEGFGNFLCYVGGLRVVTTTNREGCLRHERRNVSQLIEARRRSGGRIFVFDEFFDGPAAWRASHRPDPEALALADRFRGTQQPVYRSDAGTTYRLP
jgi:Protein of unknown function (DUF2723)